MPLVSEGFSWHSSNREDGVGRIGPGGRGGIPGDGSVREIQLDRARGKKDDQERRRRVRELVIHLYPGASGAVGRVTDQFDLDTSALPEGIRTNCRGGGKGRDVYYLGRIDVQFFGGGHLGPGKWKAGATMEIQFKRRQKEDDRRGVVTTMMRAAGWGGDFLVELF